MKKLLLLSIFIFSFQNICSAQKQGRALIDSLLAELPRCKEDSNKVNVLYSLADNYEYSGEFDKGISYANSGLLLAQKINNKKMEAKCYNIMGILYDDINNNDKALESYLASQKLMKETGNIKGVASTYNNIGLICFNTGDYVKALESYTSALKIVQEMGIKRILLYIIIELELFMIVKGSMKKHWNIILQV